MLRKRQAIHARDTILEKDLFDFVLVIEDLSEIVTLFERIPSLLMVWTVFWMCQILHLGKASTSCNLISLIHCSSKVIAFFSPQGKVGYEETFLPHLCFYYAILFLNWSLELHLSTIATRGCFSKISLAAEFNLAVLLTDSFILIVASIDYEMEVNYKFSRCTQWSSIISCRQMFDQYVSVTAWQQSKALSRKRLTYTSRFVLDNGEFFLTRLMKILLRHKLLKRATKCS